MSTPLVPPSVRWALQNSHLAGIARAALLLAVACLVTSNSAYGQNPGDPLFCQPNEGTTFLIVNGGGGIFSVDPDCYNNNIANDTDTTIATTQGGTLTLTRTPGAGNYTYTPPTAGFTGLDTFSIHVTTVFNSAGGPGSAGGSARPGGPATLAITLNVIPATTTLAVPSNTATLVPVPAGSVASCSATQGNPGTGPPAGTVSGCVTSIARGVGSVAPSHGTLLASGNTLQYTPTTGYIGSDTFTYQALGVNTDGLNALDSGNVTVQVTVGGVGTPITPLPPTGMLVLIGLASMGIFEAWRRMRRPAEQ